MKHRNTLSFLITSAFYIAFGSTLYFFQYNDKTVSPCKQDQTIQISLSEFTPKVIPPEEPEVEDPKPKEEPVEEETEPEKEPEEVLEEKPEPVKEVVVPPVKPEAKPKPVVKKEKPKKKKVAKKKRNSKPQKTQRANTSHAVSTAEINRLYAQVRHRINKHKSYPKTALRRRMQGSVKVSFTILKNGNVSNVRVSGPKIFHKSARTAVKRAVPFPTKAFKVSLPKSVTITLHYKIR